MKSPDFANSSRLLDIKIQSNQRSMTLPEKKTLLDFGFLILTMSEILFFSNL